MNDDRKSRLQHPPDQGTSEDDSLRRMFFDGLPAMAGIVTLIAQPFAQDAMRHALRLPPWLPIALAIAVSGLLAVYKMKVVRRVAAPDCVICVPVLMLVIFSAYAAGNNAVYYLKEGYTRPETGDHGSSEELTALKQERDILQKQLQSAQELIGTLRGTLHLPESNAGKRQSSLPAALAALRAFVAPEAYAQEPDARPRDRSRGDTDRQQLQSRLRKYDIEQRELSRKLEAARQERERNQTAQPKPLIKSW